MYSSVTKERRNEETLESWKLSESEVLGSICIDCVFALKEKTQTLVKNCPQIVNN